MGEVEQGALGGQLGTQMMSERITAGGSPAATAAMYFCSSSE